MAEHCNRRLGPERIFDCFPASGLDKHASEICIRCLQHATLEDVGPGRNAAREIPST